jgi:hypothetical protein
MKIKIIAAALLAGGALSLAPTLGVSQDRHRGDNDGRHDRGDRHQRGDYYGDGCASYERPHHRRGRGGYGGGDYGRRG